MYFVCVWVEALKCHGLYIEVKRTAREMQSSLFALFLRQDPSFFSAAAPKWARLWPHIPLCLGDAGVTSSAMHPAFCVGSRAQTQVVKLLRAKPSLRLTWEAILRSSLNNPLAARQWNPKALGSLGSGLGEEMKQRHMCAAADTCSVLPSTFI